MPAEWEKHEGTWLQWPHDEPCPVSQMRMEHIWLKGVTELGIRIFTYEKSYFAPGDVGYCHG